jgi:hypothetical protein
VIAILPAQRRQFRFGTRRTISVRFRYKTSIDFLQRNMNILAEDSLISISATEPTMDWIALKSRLVSEIAYDAEHEVLHIRLRTGMLKRYENISPTMFENLRTAESPGFYFSYYIARTHQKSAAPARSSSVPAHAKRLMRLLAVTGVFLASANMFIH